MKDIPQPKAYKTGGPPTNLDFEKALMFFHAYMYGPVQGKLRLYSARGVRPGGVVSFPVKETLSKENFRR